MDIYQTIKLLKKVHSEQQCLEPISFQWIDKSVQFSEEMCKKHQTFIDNLAPVRFFGKATWLFLRLSVFLLVFSLVNTGFTICLPFINKYLIKEIKNIEQRTFGNILIIVAQVLGIKLVRILFLMIDYLMQQYLGCVYYCYMQSNILRCLKQNKSHLSGNKTNLLEDDSERVINMPYCILNGIQIPLQILTLTTILITLLPPDLTYLFAPIIILIIIQCLNGYASYRINGNLMKCKDKRLQCILRNQSLIEARKKQIENIKNYLLVNIFAKIIGQLGYGTLYFLIFWLSEQQISTDDKYSILMILTLLRSPFQGFSNLGVIFMSNFSSLKRIQKGTNQLRSNRNKLAQDFDEDYSRFNNQKLNQSFEYQVDKNSVEPSALSKEQKIQQRYAIEMIPKQIGQIKIGQIYRLMRKSLSLAPFIVMILCLIAVISANVWAYTASQNVISQKIDPKSYIPLPMQILVLALLYAVGAYITLSLSRYISKLMEQKSSYEILNRFSGDIRALDVSFCCNGFDFLYGLCLIFASFIYNVISIKEQIISIAFLAFISCLMFATFKIHRYMMWTRRQILREGCKLKAKLIGSVNTDQSYDSSFDLLVKIFKTKALGFFIQALGSGIVMLMSTIVSIVSISVCLAIQIPESSMAILLFALLQIDLDLHFTFIYAIKVEMSLISVERTLNAAKIKLEQKQTEDN